MKDEENVEELIKIYVYPLLDEECKRLGIPRNFIKGVYSCPYKGFFEGGSYLEEIKNENGNVKYVKIRICEKNDRRGVLEDFFHEMWHAKETWEGKESRFSELRADLYAEKRILQLALSGWKYLKANLNGRGGI